MAERTRRGVSLAQLLVALAVLGVVAAVVAFAVGRVGW
jgi:Tfp pilus assembly protein FimT